MIPRNLETFIKKYSKEYPAIAIVGPRQSGKTTLALHLFPAHKYISLENMDIRQYAEDDPRGFLNDYDGNLILDEVQRAPILFSYLQEKIDFNDKQGRYILTGSSQFLLMEAISQSLAGRIASFKLLPFSMTELLQLPFDTTIESIITPKKYEDIAQPDIYKLIFTGCYPRIHDKKLNSEKWIENYLLTYVERDIRNLINLNNLRTFENFLKICASFSGQLVNFASISNMLGVSQPTVKKWLSLLETSSIIFFLPPFYKNFSKRIVKSPKLYFIDTGLLCFLLSIRSAEDLKNHYLYGNIFETFIISEFFKRICHLAEIPPLYFWRDKTGNEIDLIIEYKNDIIPIEIKSAMTYTKSFSAGIRKWLKLTGNTTKKGFVIYNGSDIIGKSGNIPTVPWRMF
jgi:uncharacterized protein